MTSGLSKSAAVYIAGHEGRLGADLCRRLGAQGYQNLITCDAEHLDLTNELEVQAFFEEKLPDYVIFAGTQHDDFRQHLLHPANFLHDRLQGLLNVIHASYLYEIRKMLSIVCSFEVMPQSRYDTSSEKSKYWSGELTDVELLALTISGLCDRYRQQYDCDFIAAHFEFSQDATAREDQRAEQMPKRDDLSPARSWVGKPGLASVRHSVPFAWAFDDPVETCLYLMNYFSSPGLVTFQGQTPSNQPQF